MVAAACGTRLDEADFLAAARGQGVEAVGGDDGIAVGDDGFVDSDSDGSGTSSGSSSGSSGRRTGSSGSGSGGGQGSNGGSGDGGAAPTTCGGQNTASDVGVTPTSILVGNIAARRGALGPEAFAGPYEGARAYFLALNAAGGVCGRKIKFVTCDDRENSDKNKDCVRNLIESQKIFAFVANATRSYAGAPEVNEAGVPDVGGIPISNGYDKWPMLFSLYGGDGNPRDGTQLGIDGEIHIQSALYRWFRDELGITKAAVIFYDEPISRTAGNFIADGLDREDVEVVYTPNGGQGRNLADPAWDGEVIRMRQAGAEAVFQAIDIAGFQKLCEAMDRNGFQVKAAVTTIAGWSQSVGDSFSSPCRNSIWAAGSSVPYSRTDHPEVKKFRDAMARYDADFTIRQWAVDGWSAAALFVEAVKLMGPNVTRDGLVKFLNSQDGTYQGPNNIAEPGNWDWRPDGADFNAVEPDCFSVAKWDDGQRAFVDRSGEADGFVCLPSDYYPYKPVPDGST